MQCLLKTSLLISMLMLLGLPAMADISEDEPVPVAAGEDANETSLLLELDSFDDSGTLSDEELNSHRARDNIEVASITINDQDQDGDVTDNVAVGNTNGDNLINGEAFSNSSGFLSTVQNSGNNVLIQNSTIINVTVETPTD